MIMIKHQSPAYQELGLIDQTIIGIKQQIEDLTVGTSYAENELRRQVKALEQQKKSVLERIYKQSFFTLNDICTQTAN